LLHVNQNKFAMRGKSKDMMQSAVVKFVENRLVSLCDLRTQK